MAEGSAQFHEPPDQLTPATRDRHRAIVSLMEELEAVDWYDQRIDATADAELVAILTHNRDEEKEHASMLLEWLRRQDPPWDDHLRTYLFTDTPIASPAEAVDGGEAHNSRPRSLAIGGLRDRKEVL
jgi:ferritin-like protein